MPQLPVQPQPDNASFRDPSGVVVWHQGQPYRLIHQVYQPTYQQLQSARLLDQLINDGLLVAQREVTPPFKVGREVATVLELDRIPFVSYPYEWSFSQLQDAALLTLALQSRAIEQDFWLKDASAYNVQFIGAQPIFIDTLSFEPLSLQPWVAYRQFCQHFLAPLALMAKVDIRLQQLLRTNIDGIPLDVAANLLPRRTKLSPSLLIHLHLHAGSQKRHAADGAKQQRPKLPDGQFSKQSLLGLVNSLTSAVQGLHWRGGDTEWADYYQRNHNYTDESLQAKEQLVDAYLGRARPQLVWDLGGNTGRFSRIAARHQAYTVCLDIDPMAVESLYRQLRNDQTSRILPLLQDFANPSTDSGWHNRERLNLPNRGPADSVLVLALVHHLAIGQNIPLSQIAAWLAALSKRQAIVEFIPKEDSQVAKLLATRPDIFTNYHQPGFEAAIKQHFTIKQRQPVAGSKRWLYDLERRP